MFLDECVDEAHGTLDAQCGGIEAEVVGGGVSPGVGAVVVVVRRALVVGPLHEGACLLLSEFGMALADALDAVGLIGGDEDVQYPWLITRSLELLKLSFGFHLDKPYSQQGQQLRYRHG